MTRNQVRFAGATADVPMLAEPTGAQREAFRLLGVPIPLTFKQPEHHPASPAKHQVKAGTSYPIGHNFGLGQMAMTRVITQQSAENMAYVRKLLKPTSPEMPGQVGASEGS